MPGHALLLSALHDSRPWCHLKTSTAYYFSEDNHVIQEDVNPTGELSCQRGCHACMHASQVLHGWVLWAYLVAC